MSETHGKKSPDERETFRKKVDAGVDRKIRARASGPQGLWFGLGMMGIIGYSVTIPAILGVMFGIWLDKHVNDNYSWTLMMFAAGLALGCFIAWHWVSREGKEIEKKQEKKNDK